jgi:amidophosphoribosyltransferase
MRDLPPSHPFDFDAWRPHAGDDQLHEECGVFGVIGVQEAASFVALGLHALQHRGQEAGGIVSHDPEQGFNSARRFGYVRDNFTSHAVIDTLPGSLAIGHVRYSTAGSKGATQIRDVQPFFGEFSAGGAAIAHNGNITNANALRRELIDRGSIFQSSSDSECIIHLMARSLQRSVPERMKDALRRVEGAFSVVAMTRTKLIGVRDALGVRPLVIGRLGDGWVLSSETCALDIVGAEFIREVEPGEMVVIEDGVLKSDRPFAPSKPRFCIFEHVYFSRPDSILGGRSRSMRRAARSVWSLPRKPRPRPTSSAPCRTRGTPAAIGFSQQSGIPFAFGIIRNQYVGRTFIEPTEQIRNMGVRLKLNINRALVKGKKIILVDDSVVRGTTSRKIKEMLLESGAAEVHFRIASPPTAWPCFYGVDTPQREKLLAATMSEAEMRDAPRRRLAQAFISLDGLYRAVGEAAGPRPEGAAVLRRLLLGRIPRGAFRPDREGLHAQGGRVRLAAGASRFLAAPAAAQEVPPALLPFVADAISGADPAARRQRPRRPSSGSAIDALDLLVRNVTQTTIRPVLPDPGIATGAAVIVVPGGGFVAVDMGKEGMETARALAERRHRRLRAEVPDRGDASQRRGLRRACRGGCRRLPDGQAPKARSRASSPRARTRSRRARAGARPRRGVGRGPRPHRDARLLRWRDHRAEPRCSTTAAPAPAFAGLIYGRTPAVDPPDDAPPLFVAVAADDPLFGPGSWGLIESWRAAGPSGRVPLLRQRRPRLRNEAAGRTPSDLWFASFLLWLDARDLL